MVAGRPWYHAYPADFFTATQGWDLDMKGPYRLLIDLLNERDRPIPDDPKFIAGILGCSVQRWKKVRLYLLEQGKLIPTPDGQHLTNPRFEREHEEREEKRLASAEYGRQGGRISAARRAGQSEFDLDDDSRVPARDAHTARTEQPKSRKKIAKESRKSSKSSPSHSQLSNGKSPKINETPQAPPQAPCARESPETRVKDSTHPNGVFDSREPGRLGNADLKDLYDAVCEAAGVCFVQPVAIDRAMTQVERWVDAGVDFDEVVIPTIRAEVLTTDEPTRTLGRFNAKVLHQHAKRKAAEAKGTRFEPPPLPQLSPDGEDPAFLPLRTDLLETIGASAYCLVFNHVRFEDKGRCQGDKRPLGISEASIRGGHCVEELRHGRWSPLLRTHAAKYGFTDVW